VGAPDQRLPPGYVVAQDLVSAVDAAPLPAVRLVVSLGSD
jgi:hypothetical protein